MGFMDKAKDVAGDIAGKADDLVGKVEQAAEPAWEKVKDVAGDIGERVEKVAGPAWEKARDVAGDIGDRAKEVAEDLGERAKHVAGSLRDRIGGDGDPGATAPEATGTTDAGGDGAGPTPAG